MKKILSIATFILLATTINAQLLWKVSGNGLKQDSYIFGTHHVAPVTMIDSIKGLAEAIKSVSEIYGEVNMDDMQSPDMQQLTLKYYMAPADSTLDKVLNKLQLDSINALFAKYTNGMMTIEQMKMLKPSALSTTLAMLQSTVAFPGFDPQKQLDTYIQTLAKKEGKKTKGFETFDYQLNLLFGDPISEQAEALMKSVRLNDLAIEKARELATAYLTGDLDKIEALILDKEIGFDKESADKMLYDRNSAWEKILIGIIPTTSVLVAVGAGHLPGDKGLLNLLRKSGYNVTPVK